MYDRDSQHVLRCSQCNKPFDKESTLKRHGYYCRSRKAGRTTRTRSCNACARGKARCDSRRPQCSRCVAKAIDCHYPASSSKITKPKTQQSDSTLSEHPESVTQFADLQTNADSQASSNSVDEILDRAITIPNLEFENLVGEYLDWYGPNIDFTNLPNVPVESNTLQYVPSGMSTMFPLSNFWDDQTFQLQQVSPSSKITIPKVPTHTPRSLIQRPKIKNSAQSIADLILHTLRSYPLMIQRHDALPPFIHPHIIYFEEEKKHMEPLSNCLSLIHMISRDVQGSRKLFWKNVQLECERLCQEHEQLDRWELTAAMQALSIYILIRVEEGETDHNNLDFLLIATVTAISKQLACSDILSSTQSALYNHGLEPSWKDWIFEESRRRLCVVYQVVNLLVYFEPAAMCDHPTDLIIAPLPSRKQLWEAGDEVTWKVERQKDAGFQADFGLAANGELVKLDQGQQYSQDAMVLPKSLGTCDPPRSSVNWQEWCAGMDSLGSLVMLAASLVSA